MANGSVIQRWCRVEYDGRVRYGLLDGNEVRVVEGTPFDTYQHAASVPLSAVRLLTPVTGSIYTSGLNYVDHGAWGLEANLVPERRARHLSADGRLLRPDFNHRGTNALIASGERIVIPAESTGEVHYEGELVLVVGRAGRRLCLADAADHVLGYTLGNDVSEREWQRSDGSLWRAKSSDTFKPLGPVVATGIDPMDLPMSVRINGKVVSEWSSSWMVFNPLELLVELTRFMTVQPGDTLWLGSYGATVPPLEHGDVVEIVAPPIGVLRNEVVREAVIVG